MSEIIFECASVPVAVAAEALKMDAQTVRLLLRNNLVDWGICYQLENSSKYCYLIYPKKFYEATGYAYKEKTTEEISIKDMKHRYEELLSTYDKVIDEMQPSFLFNEDKIEELLKKRDEVVLKLNLLSDLEGGADNDN